MQVSGNKALAFFTARAAEPLPVSAKFLCLLFLNVNQRYREDTCDVRNSAPA